MVQRCLLSSAALFKATASAQISSAAVSFVCSSIMAIMIKRSENGLSTPYRRIIFGVSVSDIIQSLAYLLGPFLVPSEIQDSWGIGNKRTCRVQGCLLVFAVAIVPMYMCFLCFYYLCKLKYRMSNEEFAYKFEAKIHSFIIFAAAAISISGLIMNVIHTPYNRTTCGIAVAPVGCRINSELYGECDPTIESRANIIFYVSHSLNTLSILGIIGMTTILYQHAITFHHIYQPDRSSSNTLDQDASNLSQHVYTTYLSRIYRNEIVLEATFYVGAFVFTYTPLSALYLKVIIDGTPTAFLSIFAMISSPLAGFFNILVYTRQSIASLRRNNPTLSWLSRFWIVLKAGGQLPPNQNIAVEEWRSCGSSSSLQEPRSDSRYDLPSDFASPPRTPSPQISVGPGLVSLFDRDKAPSNIESKPKRRWYQWPSKGSSVWGGLSSIKFFSSGRKSVPPFTSNNDDVQ